LDGFAQVLGFDRGGGFEIGDGARYFQDAVVGAGGEAEALDGVFEEFFAVRGNRAMFADELRGHLGVGVEFFLRAVAVELDGAGAQDAEGSLELIDPHVFRACADPRNLPFSNEAGEGFENKIAELFARKLGKSVAYMFYPDATGFIRNTLNAHRCDVVLGIAQGDDFVQPTNPYYRTSYVAAYRQDGPLKGLDSLSDPRLKTAKIGIVEALMTKMEPNRIVMVAPVVLASVVPR